MKLRATVVLVVEYEVDINHYGCVRDKIPGFEISEYTMDPIPLFDMPDSEITVKVEEIP